jgi:hypothetical protein
MKSLRKRSKLILALTGMTFAAMGPVPVQAHDHTADAKT